MSRARLTAQSFRRSVAISRMSLGRSSDQEDGTATETVSSCSSSDIVRDEMLDTASMTAPSPRGSCERSPYCGENFVVTGGGAEAEEQGSSLSGIMSTVVEEQGSEHLEAEEQGSSLSCIMSTVVEEQGSVFCLFFERVFIVFIILLKLQLVISKQMNILYYQQRAFPAVVGDLPPVCRHL